ncbi:hypothetical protein T12_6389, partial [Trichinella patagoniensis]
MRSKCAITKISTHFAHYRNGLHHQHRARSYSCVSLGWLNGVTQYWSRNLCGFPYHRIYLIWMNKIAAFFCNYPLLNMIRNHVITKHYYQLMPLSLATVNVSLKRQGSY